MMFDNKNTLITVVDMINGFCVGGALASVDCARAVLPVKDFLDKHKNASVAFLRDSHGKNSAEFDSYPPHCVDSFESAVVDELMPHFKKGTDVLKNSTNGFFALNKKFPNFLNFDNFVIVGVCTDICVLQLALTLKAYLNENDSRAKVYVLKNCVSTFDAPNHGKESLSEVAFRLMTAAGIIVE